MLEILNQLANTTKRTEKEQILSGLEGQTLDMFKKICWLAYDPSINFYIKKFNKSKIHHDCGVLKEALHDLENMIASRLFTGNMAKQWIESQYTMLPKDQAEVFARVINRDLRCGISASTINKIWPNLIYVHPYMRCSSFSESNLKNMKYPCYSQTKMDGLYVDIIVTKNGIEYRSRNGSILPFKDEEFESEIMERYETCFNDDVGFVFMGEAIALDENNHLMERASSNGYLNSNDIDPNRIMFYFWDLVIYDDFKVESTKYEYHHRFNNLQRWKDEITNKRFNIVDSVICNDQFDIIDHFRQNRLKGEEGTIIKNKQMVWKDGTSKEQIKIKVVFECEMKAIEWKYGKTDTSIENQLGAIRFESSDSEISVWVGSGYSADQRQEFIEDIDEWIKEERIATIRANDVVNDENGKSLFLSRFVEWRTDKTEADSCKKIEEQVKSFTDALKMIKKG